MIDPNIWGMIWNANCIKWTLDYTSIPTFSWQDYRYVILEILLGQGIKQVHRVFLVTHCTWVSEWKYWMYLLKAKIKIRFLKNLFTTWVIYLWLKFKQKSFFTQSHLFWRVSPSLFKRKLNQNSLYFPGNYSQQPIILSRGFLNQKTYYWMEKKIQC